MTLYYFSAKVRLVWALIERLKRYDGLLERLRRSGL